MSDVIKRTWAKIDLDAIVHNYKLAVKLSGNKNVIPVIKANAYGHGDAAVAKTLVKAGANIFAVATASEAINLRKNGIDADILVLGASHKSSFDTIIKYGIIQEVSSYDYAKELADAACRLNSCARVHIKADTGMGRIGFAARRDADIISTANEIKKVFSLKGIKAEGMFAHFATADIPDDEFAKEQLERFRVLNKALNDMGITFSHLHVSNSGAIINYPNNEFDTVREGIILYGYNPDKLSKKYDFRPAMTVCSFVSHISHIRKGESIGYGRTFIASEDMDVAVIPIGYADGYNRLLSNKGKISVNGILCPVVGRVCMDQLMIDVTGMDVSIGDEADVMGGSAPDAEETADMTGTISYEVLCAISRPDRIYYKNGKIISYEEL